MIRILAISSFASFVIAWFLNILLLFLLVLVSDSVHNRGYRVISFSIAIFDLLFSAAYAITVPIWHADGSGLVLLIPVGYTSTLPRSIFLGSLVRPGYVFWHAGMLGTSFLVATTFTYRYSIFCNSSLLKNYYYSNTARALVYGACGCIAFAHGILLDRAASPVESLTKTMNRLISDVYGVNFSRVYYQGNDMADPNMSVRSMITMALSALFEVSFIAIIVVVCYTGSKIYSVIRNNSVSARAKVKQQQVFRMLVCQALSPFFFLYLPPLIDAASVTIRFHLPISVCIAKSILVYLFPIANPLAIIFFTDDYRYFLRHRRQPVVTEKSITTVTNLKNMRI